jgi:hypothetical protein
VLLPRPTSPGMSEESRMKRIIHLTLEKVAVHSKILKHDENGLQGDSSSLKAFATALFACFSAQPISFRVLVLVVQDRLSSSGQPYAPLPSPTM